MTLTDRLQKLWEQRGLLINKRAELIRRRKSAAVVETKLQGVTTKILKFERRQGSAA